MQREMAICVNFANFCRRDVSENHLAIWSQIWLQLITWQPLEKSRDGFWGQQSFEYNRIHNTYSSFVTSECRYFCSSSLIELKSHQVRLMGEINKAAVRESLHVTWPTFICLPSISFVSAEDRFSREIRMHSIDSIKCAKQWILALGDIIIFESSGCYTDHCRFSAVRFSHMSLARICNDDIVSAMYWLRCTSESQTAQPYFAQRWIGERALYISRFLC